MTSSGTLALLYKVKPGKMMYLYWPGLRYGFVPSKITTKNALQIHRAFRSGYTSRDIRINDLMKDSDRKLFDEINVFPRYPRIHRLCYRLG